MCCVSSVHVAQRHVSDGQWRGVLAHGQQPVLAGPGGLLAHLSRVFPNFSGVFPHIPGLFAYLPCLFTYVSWIQPNKPGLLANLSRCVLPCILLLLSALVAEHLLHLCWAPAFVACQQAVF